jgi:hypothetical protein
MRHDGPGRQAVAAASESWRRQGPGRWPWDLDGDRRRGGGPGILRFGGKDVQILYIIFLLADINTF